MSKENDRENLNVEVVKHFGKEWKSFTNNERSIEDLRHEFNGYFSIFPWEKLPETAEGFDAGCGSGRWAEFILSGKYAKIAKLNCVDPSDAIEIARNKLSKFQNATFYNTTINDMPLGNSTQDFGYCLGVLHHIPDTLSAMKACVDKLKTGAPFLVYMYYNFENRPWWFKLIWKCSDILRKCICKLPHKLKVFVTNLIATLVYYPLAKIAFIAEKLHLPYKNIPLSAYRKSSFYNMKNCALDRFGTCYEKRYSKADIVELMTKSGLENISFSEDPEVNWVAIGYKKA